MYQSVEAAISDIPNQFQGVTAMYRLGKRVVVISGDGAFLLQGREGMRRWTRMHDMATDTPSAA
jgi:hypothetical protein